MQENQLDTLLAAAYRACVCPCFSTCDSRCTKPHARSESCFDVLSSQVFQLRSLLSIALLFFATTNSAPLVCRAQMNSGNYAYQCHEQTEAGKLRVSRATASSQSKPKDLLGWEEVRWGMTADDIARLFGSRAERVPSVEAYGDWYYLYTVPVNLQGEQYTAILLMDYTTSKLARVDIRLNQYESPAPREDVFTALEAMLTQQYGQPDSKKDEPRSDNWRIGRSWKFQTSTVELWLYWHKDDADQGSNVGISYYPTAPKQ